MGNYLPHNGAEFQNWQQNSVTYVSANLAALGLTEADIAVLTAAQADWDPAYAASQSAHVTARSATQLKNDRRSVHDEAIRGLVRRLQASPVVSDDERRAMRITVPGDHPTPVGPPASCPLATIDASNRFRHRIRFVDEQTPTSRAKPVGVMGSEIWVKVGAAPAGPSEMTFMGLATASPYLAEFPETDGGKMAYYMLRWVTRSGERGPWSETESATIAG